MRTAVNCGYTVEELPRHVSVEKLASTALVVSRRSMKRCESETTGSAKREGHSRIHVPHALPRDGKNFR